MNIQLTPNPMPTPPLLKVSDLCVEFPIASKGLFAPKQYLSAVDDVSFEIQAGETFGLVGESGCGKSTTSRAIMQINRANSGSVVFNGKEITKPGALKHVASKRDLQMIFQDPYASLNPRLTVAQTIGEPLELHGIATGRAKQDRIRELLSFVGLDPDFLDRYPHEFSGGQRQRIGIARALATEPKLIICDEPVSALDVSVQAQVINLLETLQEKFSLTYLFVAHDLGVVRHISDRIAVMYLGQIVETTTREMLYENPLHPYATALLSAVPVPDPRIERTRKRIVLKGDLPSPLSPPSGCRFRTRCPYAKPLCAEKKPKLTEVVTNHKVACHFWSEIQQGKQA